MITIISYGSGNVKAIANVYKRNNIPFTIASRPSELLSAEKLILPGVGAFDQTMILLNKSGLRDVLDELVINKKVPILGICVGMQVMAQKSEEGELEGLGWIDAEVRKLGESADQRRPRLPHMGWNTVQPCRRGDPLLEGALLQQGFYFLHSYYFTCNDAGNILATSFYGIDFCSIVVSGNIVGVQFHPEKSHRNGVMCLLNFAQAVPKCCVQE